MKRLLFLLLLFPGVVLAQATATPTATTTPTNTFTPNVNTTYRIKGSQAFYSVMTTLLPTAVPTAYNTPQVLNKLPLRDIKFVSTLDCPVVISLDGGGASNYIVPAAATAIVPTLDLDLGKDGLHHAGNINVRGNAACSTGTLSISSSY
jgi:hypothetical protein